MQRALPSACYVANRATLPQKWPPPPRNVTDSCVPPRQEKVDAGEDLGECRENLGYEIRATHSLMTKVSLNSRLKSNNEEEEEGMTKVAPARLVLGANHGYEIRATNSLMKKVTPANGDTSLYKSRNAQKCPLAWWLGSAARTLASRSAPLTRS